MSIDKRFPKKKPIFLIFMFSKQVTSKDQEMGEMEFKAHGPIYGDERIRAGGRDGNFTNLMHIFLQTGKCQFASTSV